MVTKAVRVGRRLGERGEVDHKIQTSSFKSSEGKVQFDGYSEHCNLV